MTRERIMNRILWIVVLLFSIGNAAQGADNLTRRQWQINGVSREALVYVPPAAKIAPTPVVFAFHGHGGTMQHAATTFAYHKYWPEAIAVYMQGLNTPGVLTDLQGKKPGWQKTVGDQHDRDLKFFDAVLATLKQEYRVDERRVYATGHSNGGAFTYLLWAERGDVFAAVAPSGAFLRRPFKDLKPKPVLHVAGENDTLVRFEWQRLMIDAVRKLNGCEDGQPWGKRSVDLILDRATRIGGSCFGADCL